MAGTGAYWGYQFQEGCKGYTVKFYTSTSSSSGYTKLVTTAKIEDTELHQFKESTLPYKNEIKCVLTADDGYIFPAGKYYYGGGDKYIDSWYVTTTTDSTTVTLGVVPNVCTATYPIVFTPKNNPTATASTYTLKQNLTNCTSNKSDGDIAGGESLSVTLTATSGYYFHSTGTYTVGTTTYTIPATDTDTVTVTIENVSGDVTINMDAEKQPVTYTYNETLSHCSSNHSGTTISEGKQVITLTAATDYKFKNNGVLVVGGVESEIVASGTKTQVVTIDDVNGNVSITMNAVRSTEYSFTQSLTNCTSDYEGSTIDYGENTITLTANEGYVFTTNGHYTTQTTYKTIVASGTGTQIVDLNVTGITKLYMTADKIQTSYNYSEYLENCTSDYTETTITEGTHTITLTAGDGYIFSNAGSYSVGDTQYVIEATGNTTVSFTVNATGNVVVNMVAVEKPKTEYSYTQNLGNCVSNYNEDTMTEGKHIVVFTANSGYTFQTDGILLIGTSKYDIPATNTDTVTVSINATDDIIVTIEAQEIPTTKYSIKQNLSNCSSDYTDDTITDGKHTITLTANDGYVFTTAGTLVVGSSSMSISPSGTDKQEIVLRATGNVIITMTASVKVETLSAFNHLYSVDDDILNKLSKVRYYSSDNAYGDYGSYITNLYQLPFDLSDMVVENANIIMGYYQSSISAPQVNGYMLTVDLGIIDVDMPYDNVYDYDTCECTLLVPYFNPITLAVRDCVNKILKITLVIDLYSGYGNLVVTADDTLVHTETRIVVRKIPFVQEKTGVLLNQDILTYNAVTNPTLIVTNNTPYPTNNRFGKSCNSVVRIGDVTGYCEFDEVEVVSEIATDTEIDEIKSLLNDGVTVK